MEVEKCRCILFTNISIDDFLYDSILIESVKLSKVKCCNSITLDACFNMAGFTLYANYRTFECHLKLLRKMSTVVWLELNDITYMK